MSTDQQIEKIRHSISHLMTMAVLDIYPDTKLGVGPVIENGFYQDYDLPEPITDAVLFKLQSKIKKLIAQKIDFVRSEVSISDAINYYKNDPYKKDLINELAAQGNKTVYFYDSGSLHNLCAGPHVSNTKEINIDAFKLTKIAGAYWRGDEKNKMLTRIYGVAFATKQELDDYIKLQVEAEKRDHRKLGKELDLFMLHDCAPGMPFLLPKGMIIYTELLKFVREYSYGEGYSEVRSPQIINAELWKKSGHWGHYQENMFCLHHHEDNVDMAIKPMNCPAHMMMFQRDTHSYKELPIRLAESTTLYRNEKSGTLHGLTRVRSLSQDDTHIFLAPEQIEDEILNILEKIKKIYNIFNLEIFRIDLSTRPEKYLGEKSTWDNAEANLKNALNKAGLKYEINEGDGAFYGPKIDVKVKDTIGREWQLATIQLDYQLPQRFELTYDAQDGSKQTPVVIHRALLGSMERFLGILIEHFSGALPVWLSPVQIAILSVGEDHIIFCNNLADQFRKFNLRVKVIDESETVGNKIRKATQQKIPYLLVIGDKEKNSENLMVRYRGEKEARPITKEKFIENILQNIKERSLSL